MSDVEWICRHLADFFKDEPHKIGIWLLTPNPQFGEIPPALLILNGRGHKVRLWMEVTAWENSPPGTPMPKELLQKPKI